ncbi:MAG: YdeI/OmpD-associated family protein [Acidimicrobiia bacterium]|nr:YdeI/OmpD-associated family protein [Acidimicrobiia bacterium]
MASRPVQPMPEDVRSELAESGLADDYAARPFYQRNDYLAWIGRAKRPESRQARLTQMLDELSQGGVYMKMDHPPSRKP